MCRCVSPVEFKCHKRRTSSGNSNAQVVTSGANVLWSCYLSWKSAAQRAETPRKRCGHEQCSVAADQQWATKVMSQSRFVKTCGNLDHIKQLEFPLDPEKDLMIASKFPEAIKFRPSFTRPKRPSCDAQLGDLVASRGLSGAPRLRWGSWRSVGVSIVMGGTPQAGWLIREHPIVRNGWLGGTPISGNLHIYIYINIHAYVYA